MNNRNPRFADFEKYLDLGEELAGYSGKKPEQLKTNTDGTYNVDDVFALRAKMWSKVPVPGEPRSIGRLADLQAQGFCREPTPILRAHKAIEKINQALTNLTSFKDHGRLGTLEKDDPP